MHGVKNHKVLLSFLLFFLQMSGSRAGTCVITGDIRLDSTWSPIIYVCELGSLTQWYLASDHLIVGEIPLDQHGHFAASINLHSPGTEFVRLQLVRPDDPASTLYVGNKLENYLVLPVRNADTITIRSEGLPWQNLHVDARCYLDFDAIKSYFDLLTIRDTSGEKMLNHLISWWENGQDPALGWYAAYRFLNRFPGYQKEVTRFSDRLPRHLYAFLPARIAWWRYVLLALIVLFLLGSVFWRRFYKREDPNEANSRKLDALTNQELKILKGIMAGKSNKELASEFFIEVSTIKSHINRIYQKLEIKSRKEVRQFARILPESMHHS